MYLFFERHQAFGLRSLALPVLTGAHKFITTNQPHMWAMVPQAMKDHIERNVAEWEAMKAVREADRKKKGEDEYGGVWEIEIPQGNKKKGGGGGGGKGKGGGGGGGGGSGKRKGGGGGKRGRRRK